MYNIISGIWKYNYQEPEINNQASNITVQLLKSGIMAYTTKLKGTIMSDWKDKIEDKMDDLDNKAHELKGRAKQKKSDIESSDSEQ